MSRNRLFRRLGVALVLGVLVAWPAVPPCGLAQDGTLPGSAKHGAETAPQERPGVGAVREPPQEGADDKPGPELEAIQGAIVGPYVRITTDSVADELPAIAYDGARHEFLVVWTEDSGGNWAIRARRMSATGVLLDSSITIDNIGSNRDPAIAYNAWADEYLVVYSYKVNNDDLNIYGRRVAGDGTLPASIFLIDGAGAIQGMPAVAYNSLDHEYLVVYQSETGTKTYNYTIVGRRIASDGSLIGVGPTPIAGTNSILPDVAYNEARGEYLVVYERVPGISGDDVYAQRTSNSLGMLGGEFVICNNSYDQITPVIAAGPDEYLVVWSDGLYGTTDYDIFARRVRGDGVPMGAGSGFAIELSGSLFRGYPDVAYPQGGFYLVVWAYHYDNSSPYDYWDIYGRYVLAGQDTAWDGAFGIDTTSGAQMEPAVACARTWACFVVEQDYYWGNPGEIGGYFVKLRHVYLPLMLRNVS